VSVILIIAAFQAFLLAFLLFAKKQKGREDYILSGYFLVSAITILLAYFEIVNRNNGFPYPWLTNTSVPPIMLLGPLIWLYVKSLTKQNFRLKWIYSLLLVPFVFVLTLFIVKFYILSVAEKISVDSTESFRSDYVFPLVSSLIAISNIGYTTWGIALIERYRKNIKAYFSHTDSIDLAWLKFFLVSTLISYIAISGLYMADAFVGIMDYNSLQVLGYGIVSVFVMILGFYGLKNGSVFSSHQVNVDVEPKLNVGEIAAPLSDDEQQFVGKLLAEMNEKKYYQNPEITLARLSEDLKVTPDYLSGILNGRLNMNFFDFINHYRIEEFKKRCKDPQYKNLTLIAIAYDCGFNSKATFNRVFKKNVGSTPGEYYKGVK
jgi:AraC-like DNA-binding protein